MGKRLKNIMTKNEFVIENEDDGEESPNLRSIKASAEKQHVMKTDSKEAKTATFKGLVLMSEQSENMNFDKEDDSATDFDFKMPFSSQQISGSSRLAISSTNNRKSKKEFRNRSSEFLKNSMNLEDFKNSNRNSNELIK